MRIARQITEISVSTLHAARYGLLPRRVSAALLVTMGLALACAAASPALASSTFSGLLGEIVVPKHCVTVVIPGKPPHSGTVCTPATPAEVQGEIRWGDGIETPATYRQNSRSTLTLAWYNIAGTHTFPAYPVNPKYGYESFWVSYSDPFNGQWLSLDGCILDRKSPSENVQRQCIG